MYILLYYMIGDSDNLLKFHLVPKDMLLSEDDFMNILANSSDESWVLL